MINEEHASMIASWIDNRPTSYSSRDNPYEFQLILRGIKGTNEILGGFNPLAWDKTKEGWMKTAENRYGPYFGDCEFMIKSFVSNFTQDTESLCRKNTSNYEKLIRKTKEFFSIMDYEVFKVAKKSI
ncbi:hypothetical protein Glove_13g293 [Diversispora epigaea]|uniref:TLDc domain-containing protein n=1 Tax=Diversispora epigaea TaxID=1348612 RepID=A0A397JP20_9GLOM|nr:hypothetical protein Glove_13g293 [Diversispora epigaea]